MTTVAAIGHGSVFSIGDAASPEAFTAVAGITSITPPGLSRDSIDATQMNSLEKWREFIAGLKDAGECTIEGHFVPGGDAQDDLIAALSADAGNFRITFPNANTWTFSAFCTGFETTDPLDDKMMFTATFKLSGKPTFAA